MKVIVVTNRKGGVGKTTMAVHLGAGLALLGYRVGLVDTDAQGHVAIALGMKKENALYHLLCDADSTLDQYIRIPDPARITPPDWNKPLNLLVIPSDRWTVNIPRDNENPFAFRLMLEALAEMNNLDFIVVDTGPTASQFDGSVNFAANYFLYVTELAYMSLDGLNESVQTLQKLNKETGRFRDYEAQILGVIPNKARYNLRVQRRKSQSLNKQFAGLIFDPVFQGVAWEEAADYGQTVFSYSPDSKEAQRAMRLVEEVVAKVSVYG